MATEEEQKRCEQNLLTEDQHQVYKAIIEPTMDRLATGVGNTIAATKDYFITDMVQGQNGWLAEVCRAWVEYVDADSPYKPSLSSYAAGSQPAAGQIKQLFVIATIPALYDLRPEAYPIDNDPNDANADWETIKALQAGGRLFVSKDPKIVENFAIPLPGEKVYVDFEHRNALRGPIYIGAVNKRRIATPSTGLTGLVSSIAGLFTRQQNPNPEGLGDQSIFRQVDSTIELVTPNPKYDEQRVRAMAFASLSTKSALLVEIPGGVKLHKLFAVRLAAMNRAWVAETGNPAFESKNAHRKPPEKRYAWLKNPNNWEFKRFAKKYAGAKNLKAALARGGISHYGLWEAMLLDEYGGNLKLGHERRAWNSPHQCGLAIDFSNNRLTPSTKRISIPDQESSVGFKWLQENAHKFGINPYEKEPWHWECVVPRANFWSGEEFSPGNYNVRVVERSKKGKKLATSAYWFAGHQFT